jgi:HTH-type transcriptional regulator/antitoxin HigA
MKTNRPAEVFPPGEFIREELECRGWTQADLAAIIGRPVQTVSLIVNGKKAITPDTAHELAAALGTTAELWMNLQVAHWLSRKQPDLSKIKARARLYHAHRSTNWKRESDLKKSRH